jgi:hypothetical protein
MQNQFSFSDNNIEQLYTIGFRITPEPKSVWVYALILYYEVARNDQNRPLTSDGRIVLFRNPSQATDALSLGDIAFRKYGRAPEEIAAEYDVPMVLDLVSGGFHDDSAEVVNLLNQLLDLVTATGIPCPKEYWNAMGR